MSPGCLDVLISHLGNALLAKTELQPLVTKSQQSFSEFTTEGFKEYYSASLSLLPQTGNYFKVPGTTNLTAPPPLPPGNMEGKIENIRLSFSAAGGFLATATATASFALPAYERVSLAQRRRPGMQMWLWAADSSFLSLRWATI